MIGADSIPCFGCPDLHVRVETRDDDVAVQPGILAQILRQQYAALLVQFGIGRARKQQAAKLTRLHIGQRERTDLLG